MENFSDIFTVDHVRDITAQKKNDALVELCNMAANDDKVIDLDELLRAIIKREKVMSTGIGMGIAIPHTESLSVKDFVIVIGRCKDGIDFESLDGQPVNILILIAAPANRHAEFLKIIAFIGKLFMKSDFKQHFLDAQSGDDMMRIVTESIHKYS